MRLVRTAALVVALLTLAPTSAVLSQELPPGPTTQQPLSRLPVEFPAGRYDEAQILVLDFAPGAWTPQHTHGGLTLVRVLEGEMKRRTLEGEDIFGPGEGWVESPGDFHSAGNDGATSARVLVTFLLPLSAPLTTVQGTSSQVAPPGPTTVFQSKRVPTPVNAFDEAGTTMLGFAPGAWTPLHSHAGLTLVGVVEGTMTVRSGARETVYGPGDLWIEQPGDIHMAGNATGDPARVSVSFLQSRGQAVTTLAAASVPAAAPAQLPSVLPRTGDLANSSVFAALSAAAVALIGAGALLRRRIGQR